MTTALLPSGALAGLADGMIRLGIAAALLWIVADLVANGREPGEDVVEDDVVLRELVASPVTPDEPPRAKGLVARVVAVAWAVVSAAILVYAAWGAVVLAITAVVPLDVLTEVIRPNVEGAALVSTTGLVALWRWERAVWEARTRLLSPTERHTLGGGSA